MGFEVLKNRLLQGPPGLRSGRARVWGSQAGQGTVEYILVLIVVLIIILNLLYQFNSSFKSYAEQFFDGYIACLLEVGELPGTGSMCTAEYHAFDPKGGKALLKDNLPNPKDGGGQGGKNQASQQAPNKGNNRGETMGGGGGGAAPIGRFESLNRPSSVEVGKFDGEKSESAGVGNDSLIGVANTVPVARVRDSGRPESVQYSYSSGGDDDETAKKKPRATVAGKSAATGESLRPNKTIDSSDRGPAASKDSKDHEFSMSEFIRFILIILIIVAMVIFFGGQLLSIAKSQEKGGD